MDEKKAYVSSDVMGEVRLSDEVVANIAGIAALEVEGVAAIAFNGKGVGNKSYSKAIRVEMCDKLVSVDISLIVDYGYKLQKVGAEVQERVRTIIKDMTGFQVSDVNVRIEGINVANM